MQSIKQTNKRTINQSQEYVAGPNRDFATSDQLQGLSYDIAELFGKPHIGAFYTADDVGKYERVPFFRCPVCGNLATNCHHVPARKYRSFLLKTPLGIHVLKPALFALCGSGTTGCHGFFHSKILTTQWVWRDEESARNWWNGEILKRIPPHSSELFDFGFWRISNKKTGEVTNFLG